MKDNRLTVGMAMGRMNEMENLIGEPVMMKLSDTDSDIHPDDIILGVDPNKPLFYVCSPKQKLRVRDISITAIPLIERVIFNIQYVVDGKFITTVVRVMDLNLFRESTGFMIDSISINSSSMRLSGGSVLPGKNMLTVRLEALLDSMLCCMEKDDIHTLEYVDMKYININRMGGYARNNSMERLLRNTAMRGLWGNVAMGGCINDN